MFDFLTPLKPADFQQKTEYLIDGFIAKRVITLIYSPGGSGKSWLATAIAKHAANEGMNVLYLDFDNSLDALESRDLSSKLLYACPTVHYELGGKSKCNETELLDNLVEKAHNNRFKDTLVIFDTLTEFIQISQDNKAQAGLRKIKRLRDAGATVILLHHTTKNGSNYQGSSVIRNSIDNMFKLEAIESTKDEVRHLLTVDKDRVRIVDIAICTKSSDLSMMPIDLLEAKTTPEDKAFIEAVKTVLIKQEGINKTDLLTELGYEKTHRPTRDKLNQFEEIHWTAKKDGKYVTYWLQKQKR